MNRRLQYPTPGAEAMLQVLEEALVELVLRP